jgi:septal ring factor EnvC (AmiA/AmiB activator)|tara:strand:- start:469 stop:1716 length:1248 start_codon:yes stop_codon:yes gene_type:complete
MKQNSFLFILLLITYLSFGQNKDILKQQQIALEKEINYTTSLLNKTKENKKSSLVYIDYLDKKISSQERLLQLLNIEQNLLKKQIFKLENKILENEKSINDAEKEIIELKKEYGEIIYSLQKNKNERNDLMFIISSETFNQAYKRILFLREYSRARKTQALQITKNQDSLAINKQRLFSQKELIKSKKEQNLKLISNKKKSLNKVLISKDEKKTAVSKLQKSEQIFLKKIKDQQKKSRQLEQKIKKIIEEEIRLAREKIKRDKDNKISLTPEAQLLSDKFSANKGKLPWPLEQGLIIQKFGKQKHKVFGNIETFNNGINIATNKNAIIRSVFDGKISRIFFIKGEGKAVLINHGEFFTVYSGLEEVKVKLGDNILAKEEIGKVLTRENDDRTELHFEIWQGYDKQDPSVWLFEAF